MIFLGLAALWCTVHFAFYALGLRRSRRMLAERAIFRYHAASFFLIFLWIALAALHAYGGAAPSLSIMLGVLAIHGLYSLLFLEVWSLAQGGYSLSVLAGVVAEGAMPRREAESRFATIGSSKFADRMEAASRAGLIYKHGGAIVLTARGRAAASIVQALRWLARLENPG